MLHRRLLSQSLHSKKLPLLELYTKTPCPLCDEALRVISPYSHKFKLVKIEITAPGNEAWKKLYKYDIPVFHFEKRFLMKHKADVSVLVKAIEKYNNCAIDS